MRAGWLVKKLGLVAALLAGMLSAQSPFEVAPEAYHLDFENEYVRIVRVMLAPNQKVRAHAHPSTPTLYVYTQDGGPIRFSHTGGLVLERPAVHQGQMRFSTGHAEMHSAENLSDRPNSYLRVELKTDPGVSRLRGARVAASESFENTMVRIFRRPEGPPTSLAVDVDYATGRGIFRQPGETGPVPDVRIELKTSPASRLEQGTKAEVGDYIARDRFVF